MCHASLCLFGFHMLYTVCEMCLLCSLEEMAVDSDGSDSEDEHHKTVTDATPSTSASFSSSSQSSGMEAMVDGVIAGAYPSRIRLKTGDTLSRSLIYHKATHRDRQ